MVGENTFKALRPKYVPPGADIAALERWELFIKRLKIADAKKIEILLPLINRIGSHQDQGLGRYFYTHCFNEDFTTYPVKFAKCTEVGEGD